MKKQVEAYSTKMGAWLNAPIFCVSHTREELPEGISFYVYLGTDLVCSIERDGDKWIARSPQGKKISRRRYWDKAAEFACEKRIDQMGGRGSEAYRLLWKKYIGERSPMVTLP